MYSLYHLNSKLNETYLNIVDSNTFLITRLNGSKAVFKNDKAIYYHSSRYDTKEMYFFDAGHRGGVRKRGDLAYIDALSYNPHNGYFCGNSMNISSQKRKKIVLKRYPDMDIDNLLMPASEAHVHVDTSSTGIYVLRPKEPDCEHYSVYHLTPSRATEVFNPHLHPYDRRGPEVNKQSCFIALNSGVNLFFYMGTNLYGYRDLFVYKYYYDEKWMQHFGLASINSPHTYDGLIVGTMIVDGGIMPVVCLPNTNYKSEQTYATIGPSHSPNIPASVAKPMPCLIVNHHIFNSLSTCVSVCPETGQMIIYNDNEGIFCIMNKRGDISRMSFNKVSKKTLVSIYKQLIRQCGVISPCKKEVSFDSVLNQPAIDFIKRELNSPTAGKNLKVEIKEIEDSNISIKLINDERKTSHKFSVPREVWEKAFVYKEKKETIDSVAPIMRLLRIAKGSKITDKEEEKIGKKIKKKQNSFIFDDVLKL